MAGKFKRCKITIEVGVDDLPLLDTKPGMKLSLRRILELAIIDRLDHYEIDADVQSREIDLEWP